MVNQANKKSAITWPAKHISAQRYIDMAWEMPIGINSADTALLDSRFIPELISLGKVSDIVIHYIDFSQYKDPVEAFMDSNNTPFKKIIENIPGPNDWNAAAPEPAILIFDNCDSLAPLNCSLTYTLRSILTTQLHDVIKSIFIAKKASLLLMFNDSKAAFYLSNRSITRGVLR